MNANYDKLVKKLKELFELDKADLDFGIYRIIAQRQYEITDFLENRLATSVREVLAGNSASNREQLEQELEKTIQSAKDMGVEIDSVPKVVELRERLAVMGDSAELENTIYHHLFTFFSRYYDEGDFISQRRVSRNAKYAIPYNGEEVKLHWANADQYYIKTSENFRDYRFKLSDGRKVEFKLLEADSSKDNTKGDKRFFTLAVNDEGQSLVTDTDEGVLQIGMHYQTQPKKTTGASGMEKATSQKTLNELAKQALWEAVPEAWHSEVFAPAPTDKTPERTLLEKQLTDYTAKNSFDYFIHKDLGGFLRRELDFYIKNEVLFLDDIEDAPEAQVAAALNSIKAIRTVAGKVIAFLAQLENFQKKLWLKKKFVVSYHYCFTVDKLAGQEALLREVFRSKAQRGEWEKLFALDLEQLGKDYDAISWEEFLTHPVYKYLVADTKFFGEDFKYSLLGLFDDLEKQTDGVLFHSENFQVLNLIREKYRKKIKLVYVDPPYNTDSTPILYKNGYKSSSWASLISDRFKFVPNLLVEENGVHFTAIDDSELTTLSRILEDQRPDGRISRLSIITNPKGSITKDFNRVHDYAVVVTRETDKFAISRTLVENEKPRKLRRWGENSRRVERRLSFYPIFINGGRIVRVGGVPNDNFHPTGKNELYQDGTLAIWPIDQGSVERRWNFGLESIESNLNRIVAAEKNDEWDLFVTHEQTVPKTVWGGGDYDAGKWGNSLLLDLFGSKIFDFPKSINTVEESVRIGTEKDSIVLDFFAGSGTTAHAVINLNRKQGASRRYVLAEMGGHFENVVKPRIQKVIYSKDWKNGNPVSREGSTHLFKYLSLESYEDTQNNLELKQQPGQQSVFDKNPEVAEDYLLNYMLNIEAEGSLLNIQQFNDPFNYQLLIATDSAGETKPTTVDLVETFNFLLGLQVQRIRRERFVLEGEGESDNVKAKRDADGTAGGHIFVTVEGQLNAGEGKVGDTVLVIWRELPEFDNAAIKTRHNALLDCVLMEHLRVNTRDGEFDAIYVNGDNTLPNVRREEEHWKVRLIEEEFHRLMFDTRDIEAATA